MLHDTLARASGPATVLTRQIQLSTGPDLQLVDITPAFRTILQESGLQDGTATLFVVGSTGALSTVEYEPGLLEDLRELFERLIPRGHPYHHEEAWHDGNGHSHVRATLMGPSLSIPFTGGDPTLGTWQQVIFLDFDPPPRERRIVVQLIGVS